MDKDNAQAYNAVISRQQDCLLIMIFLSLISANFIDRTGTAFDWILRAANVFALIYVAFIQRKTNIAVGEPKKVTEINESLIVSIIDSSEDKEEAAKTIKEQKSNGLHLPANCMAVWKMYVNAPEKYKDKVYGVFIDELTEARYNFDRYKSFTTQRKVLLYRPLRKAVKGFVISLIVSAVMLLGSAMAYVYEIPYHRAFSVLLAPFIIAPYYFLGKTAAESIDFIKFKRLAATGKKKCKS